MDPGRGLSDDEVRQVQGHLAAMAEAMAAAEIATANPIERRVHWARYFKHLEEVNRLIPRPDYGF